MILAFGTGSCSERPAYSCKATARERVFYCRLEFPHGCAGVGFAHKMALLIIAHSSPSLPRPRGCAASQEKPHRGTSPESCIPTPAHRLVHHRAYLIPHPLRMKYTTLLYIYEQPDIQKCQSLFSSSC